MKRIRQKRKAESGQPHAGSTLVEVLASILALAIGVTMVATLYPVSILRSINATRLTRGTIHRHNAEAWIDVFTDQLVHNPDRAGTPLNPAANPRKHYDPSHPGYGTLSFHNYIVDPIGWETIRKDTNSDTTANVFGSLTGPAGPPVFGAAGWGSLPRYNGIDTRPATGMTASDFEIAQRIALSPDNWVEPLDGEFEVSPAYTAGSNNITIRGPSGGDLTSLDSQIPTTATDLATVRIVILDVSGKSSQVRELGMGSSITTTGTITWTSGGALSLSNFTPTTVRIQVRERHFTWMLTVRNRTELGGATAADDKKKANVDVVVFFRRQYSAGTNGHENTAWNFVVQDPPPGARRKYLIQAPGAPGAALSSPRPFLKKGAWLCDTINARWYRIQRIDNETSNAPIITLETAPPPDELLTKGVILPTVVEVYSLGTKQ
jgi:hypothetical protein